MVTRTLLRRDAGSVVLYLKMNQQVEFAAVLLLIFSVRAHTRKKQHATYCAGGAEAAWDAGEADAGQVLIPTVSGAFETGFSGVTV